MKLKSLTSPLMAMALGTLGAASHAAAPGGAPGAPAASTQVNVEATQPQAARVAAQLAAELAQLCPLADAADVPALESCRQGLVYSSQLKGRVADIVLWGRQRDPKLALKDSNLNQFNPDLFTGMYLPLFMFNGEHTVEYVESEKLYRFRMRAAFRNRMDPGQYPYPFWHEEEKWANYEKANEILFYWEPAKNQYRVAQWTPLGANPPLLAVKSEKRPKWDGQWMWTDAQGVLQPKATVFDGLFERNNPHLQRVEAAYKALALRLREGQCDECHVPSNPDKSKKLVMLQTPAHAASEIKRLLKSVRDDKMPRDQFGMEAPLTHNVKQALLEDGMVFEKAIDDARRWEATQGTALRTARASRLPRTPMPALTGTPATSPVSPPAPR
jgi:hypothetical protein